MVACRLLVPTIDGDKVFIHGLTVGGVGTIERRRTVGNRRCSAVEDISSYFFQAVTQRGSSFASGVGGVKMVLVDLGESGQQQAEEKGEGDDRLHCWSMMTNWLAVMRGDRSS